MILGTNAVSALFDGDRSLAAVLAATERHHLPVVANIHGELKAAGRPIPEHDLWIAALACQYRHHHLIRHADKTRLTIT
jgi:predicted nucleic acid-binding protein